MEMDVVVFVILLITTGVVVKAVPAPSPRYGTFIDYVRTTKDPTRLQLQIAYYDDLKIYGDEFSPVYNGEWKPINWTYVHYAGIQDSQSLVTQ